MLRFPETSINRIHRRFRPSFTPLVFFYTAVKHLKKFVPVEIVIEVQIKYEGMSSNLKPWNRWSFNMLVLQNLNYVEISDTQSCEYYLTNCTIYQVWLIIWSVTDGLIGSYCPPVSRVITLLPPPKTKGIRLTRDIKLFLFMIAITWDEIKAVDFGRMVESKRQSPTGWSLNLTSIEISERRNKFPFYRGINIIFAGYPNFDTGTLFYWASLGPDKVPRTESTAHGHISSPGPKKNHFLMEPDGFVLF